MATGDQGGKQHIHSGLVAEVVEGKGRAELLQQRWRTSCLDDELKQDMAINTFGLELEQLPFCFECEVLSSS